MIRIVLLCLLLGGCSKLLPLGLGGGPNVAANVQAGAENVQAVKVEKTSQVVRQAGTVTQTADENRVRVERVETIVQNEGPHPGWIVALVIAILLDSPLRWPGQIWGAYKRDRAA